jgi:hypothetical protein
VQQLTPISLSKCFEDGIDTFCCLNISRGIRHFAPQYFHLGQVDQLANIIFCIVTGALYLEL